MKAFTLGLVLAGLLVSVHAETEWCREERSKCVNKCQPDDIYFDCSENDCEEGSSGRRRWRWRRCR